MKKKLIFGLVILTLLILPLLPACGTATPDTFNLKFSTPFPAQGVPTLECYYFLDMIEQKSAGKVVFERFPGGVLGSPAEHLSLIGSGSVDLGSYQHHLPTEKVPFHNIMPTTVPGGLHAALEFGNAIEFEIPETAELMDQEWKDNQRGNKHQEPEPNYLTIEELDILVIIPLHVHGGECLLIVLFFFVDRIFDENPDQFFVQPAVFGLLLKYIDGIY